MLRSIEWRVRKISMDHSRSRWARELSYRLLGRTPSLPFQDIAAGGYPDLIDRNAPLEDYYCPVCGRDSNIDPISDRVRTVGRVATRKRIYTCAHCRYAFTNETRGERSDYFAESPYADDQSGTRSQREVDLANLACSLANKTDPCILIYGVGHANAVAELGVAGYSNVWGCDVSDDVNYGPRVIHVGRDPDFFRRAGIRFDIIVAVEVWEHFSRRDVEPAFNWIVSHLADEGMVLATTSLWFPFNTDAVFRASREWGTAQWEWWHYPHFLDHTSFYTVDNLRTIFARLGCRVSTAYFDDARVHLEDPFKRVIGVYRETNTTMHETMRRRFDGTFLNVFYY